MSAFLIWLAVTLVAILVAAWLWSIYNRLVRLRNQVETAFGQVQTELERRLELIPNLVATVKGYASHERETLDAVISARAAATSVQLDTGLQAQDLLSGALGRLMALSERYPDLKADSGFLRLQSELENTEGRISFGRKLYNESVQSYNNAQQVFPANLVASKFRHKAATQFLASEAAAHSPKVQL
jgi:LemA protein